MLKCAFSLERDGNPPAGSQRNVPSAYKLDGHFPTF